MAAPHSTKDQSNVIPLWPDGAPGSEDWTQKEQEAIFQPDIKVVRNIVQPTMTAYLPDPSLANGTAVIVCPGGACHFLSIDLERTDVARWLNSRAIAAFVLKYRLHETSDNFAREMMENLTNPERIDAVLKELRPLLIADGLGGDVSSDFAAEIAKGKLAGLKAYQW